ncbi:MAG: hypothetical protein A2081_02025 [Elusimicrobia bacterium GWC2_61_19]|nr:MAG: hypothetical protein A2081_02025 [Elusimicrobia bacterium GWC2_61_19]
MRGLLLAVGLLACARTAGAQGAAGLPGLEDLPEPTRYLAGYVSAGGGWAVPFGGHWGDKDAGFKPSNVFSLAASKRVDELLSYGLETSYSLRHENRVMKDLGLKVFSMGPFAKVSYLEGEKLFYGVLGAGLYQWSQPAFTSGGTRYGSDSGSSAGLSLGGGVAYPFWWGTLLGLDLRWHHIFNMKGSNFNLDSADNLNVMLVLHYGVWKDKK